MRKGKARKRTRTSSFCFGQLFNQAHSIHGEVYSLLLRIAEHDLAEDGGDGVVEMDNGVLSAGQGRDGFFNKVGTCRSDNLELS